MPEAEQGNTVMGRMISLLALGIDAPGMVIINRYCGSGVEAIAIASARIHAGQADVIIAGGTESMSLSACHGVQNGIEFIPLPKRIPRTTQVWASRRKRFQSSTRFQGRNKINSPMNHTRRQLLRGRKVNSREIVPITVKEVYVDENMKKKPGNM